MTLSFYDVRAGQVTRVDKKPPPVCHARERYIFMLYVRHDWELYYGKCQPVRPFIPHYRQLEVWECNSDEMPTPRGSGFTADQLQDEAGRWLYFAYHPTTSPFPSLPLDDVCGKSILRIPRTGGRDVQLLWTEAFANGERRFAAIVCPAASLGELKAAKGKSLVVVRDNAIVAVSPAELVFPIEGLVQLDLGLDGFRGPANRIRVRFGRVRDGALVYQEPPMLVKGYKGGFDEILNYIDGRIKHRPTRFPHCYVRIVPLSADERTPDWRSVKSATDFDTFWEAAGRDSRASELLCASE
jgi:hypothetical protein